jgi:hypothetical protein
LKIIFYLQIRKGILLGQQTLALKAIGVGKIMKTETISNLPDHNRIIMIVTFQQRIQQTVAG